MDYKYIPAVRNCSTQLSILTFNLESQSIGPNTSPSLGSAPSLALTRAD